MSEMTTDPLEIRGLSTVESRSVLYVDPQIAVFLNRCLFTNETVDSLTPIEVWNPETKHSLLTGTKKVKIGLPVSEGWIDGRCIYQKKLKAVLICAGLIITSVCLLLYYLPPEIALNTKKEKLLLWAVIGEMISLIGMVWSRLKGPLSDPLAMQGIIEEGRVTLMWIHPKFSKTSPKNLNEVEVDLPISNNFSDVMSEIGWS